MAYCASAAGATAVASRSRRCWSASLRFEHESTPRAPSSPRMGEFCRRQGNCPKDGSGPPVRGRFFAARAKQGWIASGAAAAAREPRRIMRGHQNPIRCRTLASFERQRLCSLA